LAFKHTGQNFHRIGFFALGDETRCAGFALIEEGLNIGLRQWDTRRAAINDTANGRAVTFSPRRKAK